jgi:catechol 2,3-dioxygenase-like lactoylglutathione lyase family enzyme
MIDHVSIPVSDLAASAAFFDRVLEPLGLKRIAERPHTIGYGKRYPEFWLNLRPAMQALRNSGHHVCLRCRSESAVEAFHAAALRHGGQSDGEPGPRQAELTPYFGAFIIDPDGNKIEAVTFPPPSVASE